MSTATKNRTGSSVITTWADRSDGTKLTKILRYIVRAVLLTFTEYKNNDLSLRSSALTYTIMLSLVPMLAMSMAIAKGLGGGDQLKTAAYSYIETLEQNEKPTAPTSETTSEQNSQKAEESNNGGNGITGHLRSAADTLFEYVDNTNFAALGTFGVLGILLSILLVFSHIEAAMNTIWKVTAGRSILRKVADYLTLLILMPLSINVAFAASAFLKNESLATKMDMLIPFSFLQSLVLKAVPVFFISLTFYAMFIFFPNTKVKTIPAVIGSLFAAILWFGVQNIYIGLQVGVAKYNAIYGSFATLPLFLVWIYLGWTFILIGAQITYTFQNVVNYRFSPYNKIPSQELSAAFDIMETIYSTFSKQKPKTEKELTADLGQYPPQVVEKVISELMDHDLIHFSQTDNRILPTQPRDALDAHSVVESIFGTLNYGTKGGILSQAAIQAAGDKTQELNIDAVLETSKEQNYTKI